MIRYSKKSKCQGCYSLKRGGGAQTKDQHFTCALGFEIEAKSSEAGPFAPRPVASCYKPTTLKEQNEAREKKEKNGY